MEKYLIILILTKVIIVLKEVCLQQIMLVLKKEE